ncbi:MAG: GAF domain-containing protein [Bacteroidales bacterium]|nr:GAF domain-containing protein [Bacteroidales bacterium]
MNDKQSRYKEVLQQAKALADTDAIAYMANVAALLHAYFSFWWVGFYRVKAATLVLGPFQGPLACTRIGFGKGVCGTAWKSKHTIVVPDVDQFEGHIACSSLSKSEIVVPILQNNEVMAVLDIDSEYPNAFDEEDAVYLEQLAAVMARHIHFEQ